MFTDILFNVIKNVSTGFDGNFILIIDIYFHLWNHFSSVLYLHRNMFFFHYVSCLRNGYGNCKCCTLVIFFYKDFKPFVLRHFFNQPNTFCCKIKH